MTRALLLTGAAIGLVFAMLFAATAWSSDTPEPCDALPRYLEWLAREHGERPAGPASFGEGVPPGVLTMGPESWTLLQFRAPGIVCTVAAGTFGPKGRAS